MVAPGAKKGTAKNVAEKEARRLHAELLVPVEEQFSEFDVVWAKVPGFPWWPGVLFFSWRTVHAAGVKVGVKTELKIPSPEEVPVLDPATGEATGAFRMQRHCLIMFLDKFNFSVVAVDPRSVASFTTHYQVHSHAILGSKKHPKKSEFRRALVKASELLHMSQDHTEEDLVLLEKPAPVEKKRRLQSSNEDDESEEDAWDDYTEEESVGLSIDDTASDDDYEDVTMPKQSRRKASPAAPRNRTAATKKRSSTSRARSSSTQRAAKADVMLVADSKGSSSSKRKTNRARTLEAAGDRVSDFEDAEMALVPAKARRKTAVAPPKQSRSKVRKASRKEGRNAAHVAVVSPSASPIDLTGTPDSAEKKPPRAKSRSKVDCKLHDRKKSRKKAQGVADADLHKRNKQSHPKVVLLQASDEEPTDTGADKRVELIPDSDDDEKNRHEKVTTPLASIWTNHASTSGSETQLAYQQDFLWDDAVFTDELSRKEKETAAAEQELAVAGEGRERPLSKRQSRSVHQSQIRQNLMMGNLDPHTMVQCAAYRAKDHAEKQNSRSRGAPTLDPPFQVVVHPDAVFVSDLHAHLATCEIIGFLGGKWDEATKTLYIQAAFPCRSLMIDGDDGSTDVEMDPESEIELRGIIQNAHLEVVGWYHSHPAFAPDPSVRDIENQASYQQLFQRRVASKGDNGRKEVSEPFVGLIVGTYDTRRDTPVSLFRYFNVRGEQVSGGARREIYMPYELVPARRHYRSVLEDEERQRIQHWPVYPSVLKHFGLQQKIVKMGALPTLPTDGALPQDKMAKPMQKELKTPAPERKRKQSLEAPGGKPPKKVKGKHGGKAEMKEEVKAEAPRQIDLTGDDEDEDEQDDHAMDVTIKGARVSDAKTPEDKSAAQEPQTSVANVALSKEATEVAQAPIASTTGVPMSGTDNDVEMEAVAEAAPTSLAESTKTSESGAKPPSDPRAGASFADAPSEGASGKDSSAPLTVSTTPAVTEADHGHSNGGDTAAKPSSATTGEKGEGCGVSAAVNGSAKESEKPRVGDEGASSSSAWSSTGPKQEIPEGKALRDMDPEVLRVVVDAVVSTASAPVNKRKNKRKNQQPQRVISAARFNGIEGEESARSREMQKMTQEMELKRHAETLDTSSRRKTRSPTKHPVRSQVSTSAKEGEASGGSCQAEAANAATADKMLHTSTTPTRPGVSPSASTGSSGSSGRRRNRKPQKTVKNTHWTSSPRGAGSSQYKATTSSTPPAQALDDVFRTQGPRFLGGSTFQATSASAAMDTIKPDSQLFDDDVEYIFAEEDISTATSGDNSGESVAATPAATPKPTAFQSSASSKPAGTAKVESDVSSPNAPSTSEDVRKAEEGEQKEVTRISAEVRVFVTSMVDQVVAECIPRVAAATVEKLKQQAPEESKPATILTPAPCTFTPVQESVKSEERVVAKKPDAKDVKMEIVADKVKPARDTPAVLSAGEPPVDASSPAAMKSNPIQQTVEPSVSEMPVDEPVKTSDKPPPETSRTAAANGGNTPAAVTTSKPSVTAVGSVKKEEGPAPINVAVELPTAVSTENGAPASASATPETDTRVNSSNMTNRVAIKDVVLPKASETVETASTVVPTLFGSNRECEDIRTSLKQLGRYMGRLKATQDAKLKLEAPSSASNQDRTDTKQPKSSSGQDASKDNTTATVVASELPDNTTLEQMHLDALRNKYGAGVSGCVAQVIALVDYYRDFGRRTALEDTWKPRINKLAKIEASLSEYVKYINLPVALRRDFVKDLVGYLRQSWTTRTQRRRMSRLTDRSGGE